MADFFNYKVPQSYYRRQKSDEKQKELLGIQIQSLFKLRVKDVSMKEKLSAKIREEIMTYIAVLLPPEMCDNEDIFVDMFAKLFKKLGLQ